MHTEKEAKQLWCPFARVMGVNSHNEVSPPSNRIVAEGKDYGPLMAGSLCIASQCMAFRWGEPEGEPDNRTPNAFDAQPEKRERRGYCGLAGQS